MSAWVDAGAVLGKATEPEEFACDAPGCSRSFGSERGLNHHKTSVGHHQVEGGGLAEVTTPEAPKRRGPAKRRAANSRRPARKPAHTPGGVFLPRPAAEQLERVLTDQLPAYAEGMDVADDESVRTLFTLAGALLQIREALSS